VWHGPPRIDGDWYRHLQGSRRHCLLQKRDCLLKALREDVLAIVERVRAAAKCVMDCLAFGVVMRVASSSTQRVSPEAQRVCDSPGKPTVSCAPYSSHDNAATPMPSSQPQPWLAHIAAAAVTAASAEVGALGEVMRQVQLQQPDRDDQNDATPADVPGRSTASLLTTQTGYLSIRQLSGAFGWAPTVMLADLRIPRCLPNPPPLDSYGVWRGAAITV
jgi:hypothetical protein